jgi:4-amino-4-deoxy-L-arabinose transferase-like glycosyltransferase
MTDSGAAAGTRMPRGPWLAVIGAALLSRVAIVFMTPRVIAWPDGREFEAVARSLVEHGTYGLQTLRPPGYPTLIAGVYALFGTDLLALRLIEAVLGTLSVVVVAQVGARRFGARAGLIAGGLMALHPVLAFLPSTQYSENTLVLLLALAFGATFRAWTSRGIAAWVLAGALFGLAVLVRPNAVMLLPGLGIGLLFALRRTGHGWVAPALAAAAALILTVAPWVVRCHRVHGEWFFVATGGGRQFWFGNNPRATGATTSLTWFDDAEMDSLRRLPDEMSRERWLYRRGMEFVRHEPARAARLYLVKLGNLFALWPETFSHTGFVNRWSRWSQGLASAAIFAGALLALRRWRADPALWPLAGAVVSFALVNAVFFTVMRYRMAFEPCLLWMAGAGWASVGWDAARDSAGGRQSVKR